MYYVRIRGKVFGPLDENQVIDMVQQGQLGRMNEISTDNRQWVCAEAFEQFFPKHQSKRKLQHLGSLELPKDDTSVETHLPVSEPSATTWYSSDDSKTGMGPFPQSDIEQMIREGKITGQTILWHDRLDPQAAETVPEFTRLFRKPSSPVAKRHRTIPRTHHASDDAHTRHGTVAPEILEQLEKAVTWSFVLVLMVTIAVTVLFISQLFLFVFIAQTGSVPLTLGVLLVILVFNLVCGSLVIAFWRYTNQLRRTLRDASEWSLVLTVKRVAELWRTCVIAPIALGVFLLLVTLLAFTVKLHGLYSPIHEMIHEMQRELPMEMPVDQSANLDHSPLSELLSGQLPATAESGPQR